jgi:hypothetical protein
LPPLQTTESLFVSAVPSQLTADVFWTRYFFHKHQIELEEEKRKNLLAGE